MPRQGIMLAYKYDEKRLLKWKPPYIVQPKFDGERCKAIVDKEDIQLLSSGAKLINSMPHINNQLLKVNLFTSNIKLDGELYKHGMSVDGLHSRVRRTVNIHKDYKVVNYHIFDFVHSKTQWQRIKYLEYYRKYIESDSVTLCPSVFCETLEEVYAAYNRYIDEGYEGIIIRNAYACYVEAKTTMMMKMKPHEVEEFTILGVHEEISIEEEPKDTLGAFVCITEDREIFNVGSGPFLTQARRINLWKDYKTKDFMMGHKMKARIKYQELTPGRGVPRFPSLLGVNIGK